MIRKIIFTLTLLIISLSSLVIAFDLSNFKETQKHPYQGGLGQVRSSSEFVVNSDICGGSGTVYDTMSELCWERDGSTYKTWANAKTDCENLVIGTNSNWVLPQKAELMTLLYHNGIQTTYSRLNSIGFSNIKNSYYWSITPYALNPTSYAYVVGFSYGHSGYGSLTSSYYVLCVSRNS